MGAAYIESAMDGGGYRSSSGADGMLLSDARARPSLPLKAWTP